MIISMKKIHIAIVVLPVIALMVSILANVVAGCQVPYDPGFC